MDEVADPRGYPRGLVSRALAMLAGCILALSLGLGQEQNLRAAPPLSEYEVKAAFLLNFIKFIEWPAGRHSPETPFTVCVLGEDPFGSILDQVVEGERVEGRRVAVRRIRELSESCEVLYVGRSERGLPRLLAEVPRGVLTVGETDDFLRQGGMIAFAIDNRRVRFDVAQRTAAKSGLRISSKLLNVARLVEK